MLNGSSSPNIDKKEIEFVSVTARAQPITTKPRLPERPKSAISHKRPFRTFEGDIIEELVPKRQLKLWWSPYMSGDEVATVYAIGPGLSNHPSPLPASETGIIEISSNELLKYL